MEAMRSAATVDVAAADARFFNRRTTPECIEQRGLARRQWAVSPVIRCSSTRNSTPPIAWTP